MSLHNSCLCSITTVLNGVGGGGGGERESDKCEHIQLIISQKLLQNLWRFRHLHTGLSFVTGNETINFISRPAKLISLQLVPTDPTDRWAFNPQNSYWYKFEPPHDKTNKVACAPSEDSDQPGHPPHLIRVFAVRMKTAWVLSYPLSAQRRLWSDWADAQADLSLRWAYRSFCWFCHEAAHLFRRFIVMLVVGIKCMFRQTYASKSSGDRKRWSPVSCLQCILACFLASIK